MPRRPASLPAALGGSGSSKTLARRGRKVCRRHAQRRHPRALATFGFAARELAQDGRPHELGDQRQPLARVGEQIGIGPGQLDAKRAPDDAAERLDRMRRGRGPARSGDLAGAGHERLEHAARLDPPEIRLVVDRADDRIADTRAVAGDVAGQDRGRLLERRVLDHRHQPALGQLLAAKKKRFDSCGDDRPWSPATWHTPLHPGTFTTHRRCPLPFKPTDRRCPRKCLRWLPLCLRSPRPGYGS